MRNASRFRPEQTKSNANALRPTAAMLAYDIDTAKPNSVGSAMDAAPCFDAEQLKGFGEQAAALAEALRSANLHDLDEAARALASGDFRRLCELAHRMKGAALVIGAASFSDACLTLQRACGAQAGRGHDVVAIRTAYTRFHDEAIALDKALEQRLASMLNSA
jgi:two-component system sensor histidine kinase EvgS